MVNHYELLAILNGKYSDSQHGTLIKTLEDTVVKHGGSIHYTQNLERKKLAYPIAHQVYGTYILTEFDCEGKGMMSLSRELRLSKDLLRHTIVRRKTVGKPKILLQEKQETTQGLGSKAIKALISPLLTEEKQEEPKQEKIQGAPSVAIPVVQINEEQPSIQEKELQETSQEAPQEQSDKEKKKKTVKAKSLDERLDEILHDNLL